MDCGLQCLSIQDVPFMVKDVCLEKACGHSINLFYRDSNTCDLGCANNCLALVFTQAKKICVETCGCPFGNNAILNLAA